MMVAAEFEVRISEPDTFDNFLAALWRDAP